MAAGASLNTASYIQSQILATPTSLVIGQIRGVDKMQIRSVSFSSCVSHFLSHQSTQIPLGYDNPRRIAYNAELKIFGVACNRPTPNRVGDAITSRNSFILYDDTTFDRKSWFLIRRILTDKVTVQDWTSSSVTQMRKSRQFLL